MHLVTVEQEAPWTPEPVWSLWAREHPLTPTRNRTTIRGLSRP